MFCYDHDGTMRSSAEPEALFTTYEKAFDYGLKKYKIETTEPSYMRPWKIEKIKVIE